MRADIEGPCGAVARVDAVKQEVMMKALIGSQSAMREHTNELAAKKMKRSGNFLSRFRFVC